MDRKMWGVVLLASGVFCLSGCATTRHNQDFEIQGLKNKVSALEAELSAKDEELNSLKESVVKAPEQPVVANAVEVRPQPKTKDIQLALKNAGYYSGNLNGKMNKQTRRAIKAFQKANNLPTDGKVGKQTWNILADYLNKKVK